MTQVDCILIPGGGFLLDGSLPPWTIARLDKACSFQTQIYGCLSGGTVHKSPPLDKQGFPIFESREAAKYLAAQGIPSDQIWTEISSYDTIGNAFFSRTLLTEVTKLRRLLIITSEFNMDRTKAAFEWIFGLSPPQIKYILDFEIVPDLGLTPTALVDRKKREKNSLKKLQETRAKITSLDQFQTWLYTEHAAYAVTGKLEKISGRILDSY